jgi:hypothetical protein
MESGPRANRKTGRSDLSRQDEAVDEARGSRETRCNAELPFQRHLNSDDNASCRKVDLPETGGPPFCRGRFRQDTPRQRPGAEALRRSSHFHFDSQAGGGKQGYQGIDRKHVQLAPHQIGNPRLRDAQ